MDNPLSAVGGFGTDNSMRDEFFQYDGLGRQLQHIVDTTEPTTAPNTPFTLIKHYVLDDYDDAIGESTRGTSLFAYNPDVQEGMFAVTTTEPVGRLLSQKVFQSPLRNEERASATYEYHTNRDWVKTVTYGNGVTSEYLYDTAGRVTQAKHTEPVGQTVFLRLDYSYNLRGLIWQIVETRGTTFTTMGFDYDYLGRLVVELRLFGTASYDLAYEYDAGGNRTKKTDLWNGKVTTYWYDTDTASPPPWIVQTASKANRLLGYEVVDTTTSNVDLRVKYEYALDSPAAGNVRQIRRMTPDSQDPDPQNPSQFDVAGTCFAYNKLGELWIVTQRTWSEDFNGPGAVAIQDIVEFRGSGRKRRMVRHRDTMTFDPLHDTAVWTEYDGDEPYGDYTVDFSGSTPTVVPGDYYDLSLGHVQIDASGQVMNFHGNQIGSTRAMSDAIGNITQTFTYTAFGESLPVESTAFNTRYQFAGHHGYESFGSFGQNFPFPYMHLGYRYYDPETGRFLQRDPIGIDGGLNVHLYADGQPLTLVDPGGTVPALLIPLVPFAPAIIDGAIAGALACVITLDIYLFKKVLELEPEKGRKKAGREKFEKKRKNEWTQRNPPKKTPKHRPSKKHRRKKKKTSFVCFVAGTTIHTEDGMVPIEDVPKGMSVFSRDVECSANEIATVSAVTSGVASDFVDIQIPAESIICTREHPLWVSGKGWVLAGDIRAGDQLVSADGSLVPVKDLRSFHVESPVRIFNLTIDGAHTFYVGESRILVHNKP